MFNPFFIAVSTQNIPALLVRYEKFSDIRLLNLFWKKQNFKETDVMNAEANYRISW